MKTNDLEQEEELKSTAEEISNVIGDNRVVYVIGDVSLEEASISSIEQTPLLHKLLSYRSDLVDQATFS